MPLANLFLTRVRQSEDDIHDQIGSNASTPPGAATPRPDLHTDKRLPQLIGSYFGQVSEPISQISFNRPSLLHPSGNFFLSTAKSPVTASTVSQTSTVAIGSSAPPSAINVPNKMNIVTSPSKIHLTSNLHIRSNMCSTFDLHSFPTPPPSKPTSSSSSMHRKSETEGAIDRIVEQVAPAFTAIDAGLRKKARPAHSTHGTFRKYSDSTQYLTPTCVSATFLPIKHFRDSMTETPGSFSAPLTREGSTQSLLSQQFAKQKLTQDQQSTPPRTPRSSSYDRRPTPSHLTAPSTPSSTATKSSKDPTVGPIIGKLNIEVAEGRGLRPSVDPYVVVQYQWAENISSGPTQEPKASNGLPRSNGAAEAIPMRRTDSESRGRAIPMSSRQSSHSGRDARQSGEQMSDPVWDHRAIL